MKIVIEMARKAGTRTDRDPYEFTDYNYLSRFAELVRADERKALIHYFNEHWRSEWSDGQIIEAIEARGNQ